MLRDLDAPVAADAVRAFASDLARLGMHCGVEVQDAVALITPIDEPSADRFADQDLRRAVVECGRMHGFMRVALIIGDH